MIEAGNKFHFNWIKAWLGCLILAPVCCMAVQPDVQLPICFGMPASTNDAGINQGLHGQVLAGFVDTDSANNKRAAMSRALIPQLLSLHHQFAGKGLSVITIDGSHQSPDQLLDLSYDWGLSFPLLPDTGQRLAVKFHIKSLPTLLLLDWKCQILQRWETVPHPGVIALFLQQHP